ncbi:MAG: DUF2207 domain-containing protein [Candidatus Peribacteria bacterium]|jgi:hypothetical protein|nr:DUF2207 domain-containing protein [Candidatus Peribacteria bacterium]
MCSFLLLFGGGFVVADLAGYSISKYNVEMSLHQDGSMEVQETIEVNFSEARHGIYRTIPYYSPSGRYTIVQQMQAIGDPASFSTENNTYQLKIGSASSTLIGDHTYRTNYIVKNAIAGFGEGTETWTELYWNVI